MIAKDWVQPVAGGYHTLSLGLLPLLEPFRRVEQLAEATQPVLSALAGRGQMTVKISVRQGDFAVTVGRGQSLQPTSVALPLGGTFHLAYGASGAVFLSALQAAEVTRILKTAPQECWAYQKPADVLRRLKEFQANGWCADLGRFDPNIHTISVPVRRGRKQVVAALTLIGFPQEISRERLPRLSRMVLEAARHAEASLHEWGNRSSGFGGSREPLNLLG